METDYTKGLLDNDAQVANPLSGGKPDFSVGEKKIHLITKELAELVEKYIILILKFIELHINNKLVGKSLKFLKLALLRLLANHGITMNYLVCNPLSPSLKVCAIVVGAGTSIIEYKWLTVGAKLFGVPIFLVCWLILSLFQQLFFFINLKAFLSLPKAPVFVPTAAELPKPVSNGGSDLNFNTAEVQSNFEKYEALPQSRKSAKLMTLKELQENSKMTGIDSTDIFEESVRNTNQGRNSLPKILND